jgi:hypothetical protein
MPVTFSSTNLFDLEAAVVTQLHLLTPSVQRDQSSGWKHDPDEGSQAGGGSLALRRFWLEWDTGEIIIGGASGLGDQETGAIMVVQTDYGSLPKKHLGEMIAEDHQDVLWHLLARLDPTIPGLTLIESLGVDNSEVAIGRIGHMFAIQYMRAVPA